MIKKFIETVEEAERHNKTSLLMDIQTASEAKNFIIIAQEARSKGGRIGGKLSKGGGRPRKYKNASERQQAYLERKKNLQ